MGVATEAAAALAASPSMIRFALSEEGEAAVFSAVGGDARSRFESSESEPAMVHLSDGTPAPILCSRCERVSRPPRNDAGITPCLRALAHRRLLHDRARKTAPRGATSPAVACQVPAARLPGRRHPRAALAPSVTRRSRLDAIARFVVARPTRARVSAASRVT